MKQGNSTLGGNQAKKRDHNRSLIRQWFVDNPKGNIRKCAEDLGLSPETIHRHIRAAGYRFGDVEVTPQRRSRLYLKAMGDG